MGQYIPPRVSGYILDLIKKLYAERSVGLPHSNSIKNLVFVILRVTCHSKEIYDGI